AIDYVSSLPIGRDGLRGAVLLGPGTFVLQERLAIEASGVVLRGSGRDITVLRKEGFDRGSLLRIEGRQDKTYGKDTLWVNEVVELGTKEISVTLPKGVGSLFNKQVEIVRQSTAPWIEKVGCRIYGGGIDALAWKPGDIDLLWRRTITDVEGNTLKLDAPLTMGFDPNEEASYIDNKKKLHEHVPMSPCYVRIVEDLGEIGESGIENLTLESGFDPRNIHDENHCWTGVSLEYARDCWVRLVNFRHLAGAGVVMQASARRITVEDCQYLEPVSENAGLRRTSFYVMGQQCLVQRCYARQGRHDFVTGFCAAGPNAFVQCEAEEALSYSGGLDSWACGTLYDIVEIDGHDLVMKNLGQDNNGAGWNAASSVAWQCSAAEIHCYSPDTINTNRAYGAWAQFSGDGYWSNSNNHVQPRSLYYAQLEERLGEKMVVNPRILMRSTEASSSPTVAKAMEMAEEARNVPRQTLRGWIEEAKEMTAEAGGCDGIATDGTGLRGGMKGSKGSRGSRGLKGGIEISNGRLTQEGEILLGGRYQTPWWNGKLRTSYLNSNACKPALTRFVPDREGTGLTDRIDSVVAWMEREEILAWDQNYGLWYDRRRDDHERIRRRDAAVWAPFWEQPWANTGEGEAWNKLSLYDLTQNNTWYYDRLHKFAEQAAPLGKLLYLEHYFQHNILEAGAHWVDSPWRPTNNVNETVFPEPVPFTGDKRIFVAEWFYDEQNAHMADLHRQYIRRNLEAFKDLPNVVHYISEEYTGPLHFTRFWVETIRDWEQETGNHVLVALAATKDVQDSILSDPSLASTIDIIDIRYWHYKTRGIAGSRSAKDDGKDVYDPKGGMNLAPRQHARVQPVGKVNFSDAYRAVNEYRQRYPEKAVVYYAQNYPEQAWAIVMAGGSGAGVKIADTTLRKQLVTMHVEGAADREDAKVLQSDNAALVYGLSDGEVQLTNLAPGTYLLNEIDRQTGQTLGKPQRLSVKSGSCTIAIAPNRICWVRRK
ncbi:MAG: pectate lyase, partial [Bacteroidales bacterium]|nr:pectate lyase [Bacteroidales bacterium]